MSVITPNRARVLLRAWRKSMAELRATLRRVRILRRSTRLLDQEEAQALLDVAYHDHRALQASLRALRASNIVKYSAVSPAAADRLKKDNCP
jgi:hypothetical protein